MPEVAVVRVSWTSASASARLVGNAEGAASRALPAPVVKRMLSPFG